MALKLYPYALTSLANVKNRLSITNTGWDDFLTRLINRWTDYIERQCGNRQFASRTGSSTLNTYTQEVYDGGDGAQGYLTLRQAPVVPGSVTLLQFRSGSPADPVWTDFPTTNYELHRDGTDGTIRVYGGMPHGVNNMRVTYIAGYIIDWTNEGDTTKHNLPAELTSLCEDLVIKNFKRRESIGKKSEGAQGTNTVYADIVEEEDQATMANFKRYHFT